MTPYEMEEQLNNLDARTMAIAQILPTLATREDLRNEVAKLATKDELRKSTGALQDDLRLTTEALQHEIETGFQGAKAHADRLNEITRAQIRLVAEQMATKKDLQELRDATKEELQGLRQEMATKEELQDLRQEMATKGDFQELRREMRLIGGHVRVIAKQVAALSDRRRKKQ